MLDEYVAQGFTKEAIINYLALLGWNPGTDQELYSLEELMRVFDTSGVQKSGAIFNIDKLKWFNKEYLNKLTNDEFYTYVESAIPDTLRALPQYDESRLQKLVPLMRERTSIRADLERDCMAGEYDFAFVAPQPNPSLIQWKKDATPRETLPRLQKLAELVATIPEDADTAIVKDSLWKYAEEVGKGEALWPLRVSLTGKEQSPDPFTIINVIGSAEAYKRIITACDTILRAS
jgi:glutamyl-tRNA synthetase